MNTVWFHKNDRLPDPYDLVIWWRKLNVGHEYKLGYLGFNLHEQGYTHWTHLPDAPGHDVEKWDAIIKETEDVAGLGD